MQKSRGKYKNKHKGKAKKYKERENEEDSDPEGAILQIPLFMWVYSPVVAYLSRISINVIQKNAQESS